jgi:hypothetical protein
MNKKVVAGLAIAAAAVGVVAFSIPESSPNERRERRRAIARVVRDTIPEAGANSIAGFVGDPTPNVEIPCFSDVCLACFDPGQNQCQNLINCNGGEPCDTIGGVDPHTGGPGRLGRFLRGLRAGGAIETWHADVSGTTAGAVTDCFVWAEMGRDQRAGFRRAVDATLSPWVAACGFNTMPAKGKRNGVRRSIPAGLDAAQNAGNEETPDDTID